MTSPFRNQPVSISGVAKKKVIVRNSAKCLLCEDEIESTYRWDFKRCKCGAIAVDGGKDYLRRVGSSYQDTSVFKEVE